MIATPNRSNAPVQWTHLHPDWVLDTASFPSSAIQRLELPNRRLQHWLDALPGLLQNLTSSEIDLDCGDWPLNCSDIKQLVAAAEGVGCRIEQLSGSIPETIVSASALGLNARLHSRESSRSGNPAGKDPDPSRLLFHQGTLRSGDHLQSDGDILLLGDVNPGAKITAAGHVLVWGRLRGVAHAGRDGNTQAKIVALQLRPLQLRIAQAVARGPEEVPQVGLAEQAILHNDEIVIEAAPAQAFSTQ